MLYFFFPPLHLTLYTLRSTQCTFALLLRFTSFVLCIYTPCQKPRTNQRRTKERPKNSETQKSTFIKITHSFTSLIPSPILPTDDREKTDRTPTQLPAHKKYYLLRSPKKVVPILIRISLPPLVKLSRFRPQENPRL